MLSLLTDVDNRAAIRQYACPDLETLCRLLYQHAQAIDIGLTHFFTVFLQWLAGLEVVQVITQCTRCKQIPCQRWCLTVMAQRGCVDIVLKSKGINKGDKDTQFIPKSFTRVLTSSPAIFSRLQRMDYQIDARFEKMKYFWINN